MAGLCTLLVTGALVALSIGFKIEFKAEPEQLTFPLSKKLTIRCSVKDGPSVAEQVVTKSQPENPPDMPEHTAASKHHAKKTKKWLQIKKNLKHRRRRSATLKHVEKSKNTTVNATENVAQEPENKMVGLQNSTVNTTEGNFTKLATNIILNTTQEPEEEEPKIRYITSIIVTRGRKGVHIASVTQYGPPTAFMDIGQVHVNGSLNQQKEPGAFLEMTWLHPNLTQSDIYKCEINGMDEFGHNVVQSKIMHIQKDAPTMQEIGTFVHKDNNILKELQRKYDDLKDELDELQLKYAALSSLKSKTTKVEQSVSSLRTYSGKLNRRLVSADRKIKKFRAPHTETGWRDCGASKHWIHHPNQGYSITTIKVRFRKTYHTTPNVVVALSYIDIPKFRYNRIGLRVIKVTTSYFETQCFTWGDAIIDKAIYSWMSVV